ncbi:MAG: hypothetical protein ACREF4_04245 [Gammaproteobacteria bacterium]
MANNTFDRMGRLSIRRSLCLLPFLLLLVVRPLAEADLPGLHVGPEPAQPDPDPAVTMALRETLGRLARGEDDFRVLPVRKLYLPPALRRALAHDLATRQAFTFIACDDTRTRLLERSGERVSRVCHYRFVNATATYYYSFWLLPDGRIADIGSSTE